jgi:hypothetical protein
MASDWKLIEILTGTTNGLQATTHRVVPPSGGLK